MIILLLKEAASRPMMTSVRGLGNESKKDARYKLTGTIKEVLHGKATVFATIGLNQINQVAFTTYFNADIK